MKRLAIVLIAALCTACACNFQVVPDCDRGCTEEKDVTVLLDLNVAVANHGGTAICGGTLVKHRGVVKVLTAGHCVDDGLGQPKEMMDYFNGSKRIACNVVKFDRLNDLALLDPEVEQKDDCAVVSRANVQPGDDIWVVGNGAGIDDIMSRGIVAAVDRDNHSGVNNNIIDCTAWYGNSGGGVYNEDLELVGVLIQFGPQFGGHGPETGFMYVVSQSQIRSFLR